MNATECTTAQLLILLSLFLNSFIRSLGEQVQYKACAGYHCCAGSGLLHHTGNEVNNKDKNLSDHHKAGNLGELSFCMQLK